MSRLCTVYAKGKIPENSILNLIDLENIVTINNLLAYDREALVEYFSAKGQPAFRAKQIFQWIHQRGIIDYRVMTDLSKSLRQQLCDHTQVRLPKVVLDEFSIDGTRKWLLELQDGNCIETVLIPEPRRRTLCISTQVGCVLNCSFCHTAKQGFNRNLQVDEIIGQLWLANQSLISKGERPVSNVVFMGMGEPLLNFDHVVAAIRIMLDDYGYGLSKRRVTISTSGVVPGIDRLRKTCPVSLAVSLHATGNELRDRLVPINRKYPIEQLLDSCRQYAIEGTRRYITFEYVMLHGINDRDQNACELANLLSSLPAKVNLIPFNAYPGAQYRCSTTGNIENFKTILLGNKIITTIRKTRGGDIIAACGQLAGEVKQRERRWQRKLSAMPEGAK